jgi:hypothetical protein
VAVILFITALALADSEPVTDQLRQKIIAEERSSKMHGKRLNDQAIKQLLVGKTELKPGSSETFRKNGSYLQIADNPPTFVQQYTVSSGILCVTKHSCRAVYRKPDGKLIVHLYTRGWNIEYELHPRNLVPIPSSLQ